MTSAAVQPVRLSPSELAGHVGQLLGYSGWRRITQHDVRAFADVTDDHQWIHVDPALAADGPFGGCVVHGFLTLALLSPLVAQVFEVGGAGLAINHRVDRVRFRAPVPVGAKVRAGVTLVSVRSRARGFLEVTVSVRMEMDDAQVACSAEQTTLYPGLAP